MSEILQNKKKNLMSSENIQDDILAEVLARIPSKMLGKFRCVSKSWRDLIDSSYFKEMRPRRMCSPIPTVFDLSRMETSGPIEAEEVGNLLRRGNPYTKVCLRTRSFGIEAARVVALTLSSVKHHLKEVDLSGVVDDGMPKAEAVQVMNLFLEALEGSVLKSLNLSHNPLGTEEGVRALGRILGSQTRLEELYLNEAGISDEAARAVAELLPRTDHLRVLEFLGNSMGSDGAIAISELVRRCPRLEDFRCSDIKHGYLDLVKALEVCRHVKKLDLSGCFLDLRGVIALSETIGLFENLTEIYLGNLDLGYQGGAEVIVNALRFSAPRLQVLELSGNGIAAASVVACIATKQHLVRLDLSRNQLSDDDAIMISTNLDNGLWKLKEIDVSNNQLTRVGVWAIAQSVVNKPEFERLHIDTNCMTDEGVHELGQMFKEFPDDYSPGIVYDDDDDPIMNDDEEYKVESSWTKLASIVDELPENHFLRSWRF